ncbi:MAG: hypothetical protein MJZ26_03360 [Fibrobacter sp.]|nr:hypothetical protein [Fibrobacter sp.]
MTKKIVLQVESEYGEILQQAVAVIKRARVNVARQLNIGEKRRLLGNRENVA